jgi:hypothetical protein
VTTELFINAGSCNFKTSIKVSESDGNSLSLDVDSECKHIKKMADAIGKSLSKIDIAKPFDENIVYEKVSLVMPGCLPCVIPAALLIALWTEAGMLLKKDPIIHFEK